MRVTGTLQVGEATPAVRDIATRQRGSGAPFAFAFAVLLILCVPLGAFFSPTNRVVGGGIGALIAIWIYAMFCRQLARFLFRRRFAERGLSLSLPLSLELTQEALDYTLGGVRHIAKWEAITELFPSRGYWIFLAQSEPFFVADRFFASKKEERAFVRLALGHMTEAAQACSPGAVHFASSSDG